MIDNQLLVVVGGTFDNAHYENQPAHRLNASRRGSQDNRADRVRCNLNNAFV